MEANDMTLDEAIAHCDEVAGACDTECRREHKQLADWLRELKDRRRYQGGDAAAMREALTKVNEWMAHRIATGGFEASPTIPTVLEDVVLPALAKPPRNCDVMSLAVARRVWFMKEMMPRLNGDLPLGNVIPFEEWLFATANEKGETDASK